MEWHISIEVAFFLLCKQFNWMNCIEINWNQISSDECIWDYWMLLKAYFETIFDKNTMNVLNCFERENGQKRGPPPLRKIGSTRKFNFITAQFKYSWLSPSWYAWERSIHFTKLSLHSQLFSIIVLSIQNMYLPTNYAIECCIFSIGNSFTTPYQT